MPSIAVAQGASCFTWPEESSGRIGIQREDVIPEHTVSSRSYTFHPATSALPVRADIPWKRSPGQKGISVPPLRDKNKTEASAQPLKM